MGVRFKYGTGVKWGGSWKYGYGTTEPWTPRGLYPTEPRYAVEIESDNQTIYTSSSSKIVKVDDAGVITWSAALGLAAEYFYLQSSNGTWYRVKIDPTLQQFVVTGGISGSPIGLDLPSPDGRLWHFYMSDAGVLTWRDSPLIFCSDLYSIDNDGIVSIEYGAGLSDEVHALQSPNGNFYEIRASGADGLETVTLVSSTEIPIGFQLESPDGRTWIASIGNDELISWTVGLSGWRYMCEGAVIPIYTQEVVT